MHSFQDYAVHKMGFEVNRFQGEVDEELVCPICSGVLEDPLQVRKTEEFSQNSNFFHSVVSE